MEQESMFDALDAASVVSDPATRIEKLRREIEHHTYLYYAKDAPEISDAAFDSLMRELRELERENPELVDPTSPTQRVGGYVGEQFAPVRHAQRMYSLDNAMDLHELDAWTARTVEAAGRDVEFVCELKIFDCHDLRCRRFGEGCYARRRNDGRGRHGEHAHRA